MDREWSFIVIVVGFIFAPDMLQQVADYLHRLIDNVVYGYGGFRERMPVPVFARKYTDAIEDWCNGLSEISRRAHDMDSFNDTVRENESPVNNVVVRLMRDMLRNTDKDTYQRITCRSWYTAAESLFKLAMYITSLLSTECDPICAMYRD